MPSASPDRSIAALSIGQHGAFTRAQAVRAGATNSLIHRRLVAGRWERAHAGVYRLAGTRPTWHQDLMVAVLAWGQKTVVSHSAAVALWTLPPRGPGPVEVTVPRGRRRHGPGVVHRPRAPLGRADVTRLDGIPVTTPLRTLEDVASSVSRELLEEMLDEALRRRLVSIGYLERRLDARAARGRPGARVLRELLDDRSGETSIVDSTLERRFLRLLASARLPRPRVHHRVVCAGRPVAIIDFAYPELLLGIETDGYAWHSGRRRWQRDLTRRNALTELGWRMLHVTWDDVALRPDETIATIRGALTRIR